MDIYTPKSLTKLRALDCMKLRARPADRVDVNGIRHQDYMETTKAARDACETQNATLQIIASSLEEVELVLRRCP